MVTTQETSFMVWGSRPLIKSPLHNLLSGQDPTLQAQDTLDSKKTDSEFISSHRRHLSSVTASLPGSRDSAESLTQMETEDRVHRGSSLNLTNTPHAMVPCSDGKHYMKTLTQCLKDREKRRVKNTKEEVKGGAGRRGPSVSSEAFLVVIEKEGLILEPTPLDLVGRSGVLADLCAQGLQQPKLDGIGHCAGNVLILIEAKVSEDTQEDKGKAQKKLTEKNAIRVSPPKQQLLMSKRLRDRRHVNRSVSRSESNLHRDKLQ